MVYEFLTNNKISKFVFIVSTYLSGTTIIYLAQQYILLHILIEVLFSCKPFLQIGKKKKSLVVKLGWIQIYFTLQLNKDTVELM